jgi:ribonuclease HI
VLFYLFDTKQSLPLLTKKLKDMNQVFNYDIHGASWSLMEPHGASWSFRRLYDPLKLRLDIPLDELVGYNFQKGISQLRGKWFARPDLIIRRDEGSMVVYIDGACRNNGNPTARASYGVYFGLNSSYSTHGLLPNSLPQTSTRVEIEALVQAIQIVQDITDRDLSLTTIKIATDSSFLVDAMSQWID